MYRFLDELCRDFLALGPATALVIVLGLAAAGAAIGLAFPKWNAEALLETPGIAAATEPDMRERPNENQSPVKTQYVTLSDFRRILAAYSSRPAVEEFLSATGMESAAARQLLAHSASPDFWAAAATPVLPFSRRDAREYGELKDAASNALDGVQIAVVAADGALAVQMLQVVSSYIKNALIRERIRAWIIKHGGETPARLGVLKAEIIDTQMKIDVMGKRVQDLKLILARYPEASKIDARQVVAITEGSDRFLSPLVQVIAAETSITQLREAVVRKERQARQLELQQQYFEQATQALQTTPLVAKLIPVLGTLAAQKFDGIDVEAEWAREVVYRIQSDLDGFATAQKSFGIRNEPRLASMASRNPLRLGVFGAAAGVLLLGLLAFVRASLKTARSPAPARS